MINFLKRFKYLVASIAVILAIVIFAIALRLPSSKVGTDTNVGTRQNAVKVESVRNLSAVSTNKNIIGTVQSLSEADLRAERAGTITQVYKKSGALVSAGNIVAAVSNAQEAAGVQAARADIESAEAGVAQAQAALNKVKGGTREQQLAILQSSTANARSALNEAITNIKNVLSTAYATVDSDISRGTDIMFADVDGANPHVKFESTNYYEKIQANNQRLVLSSIINRERIVAQSIHTINNVADIKNEITTTEAELHKVKAFLDTLLIALDGAIATAGTTESEIASYKATAEAARGSTLGALSSLSGSRVSLSGAESAFNIAKENESLGITGAQAEDVEAAEAALALAKAGLSRARAGLSSASAVYEKTLIRTPISGTLTTLSIDRGDFVNMYQSVGVVANSGALEIVAYVSKADADALTAGSTVLIEKKYKGTITNVAVGLDPVLRLVQVRIGVEGSGSELAHGESVSIEIPQNEVTDISVGSLQVKIPLAAVKFEADRTIVFSVSDSGKLVAHDVELGGIDGDLVEVLDGLNDSLKIVVDARGLYEGQAVAVK